MHHAVIFVAVQNPEFLAPGSGVQGVRKDRDAAHLQVGERAQKIIVVSGDVGHLGAFPHFAEQFLDDIIMRLRPMPAPLEHPAIDHVADEIPLFGVMMLEEIEQPFGLAGVPAEVHIRNPEGAVQPDGAVGDDRGFGG